MKTKIDEIVRRVVRQKLSEMANNNLSYREFYSDIKKMGFVAREGKGSAKIFTIPQYGDCSSITIHSHNDNARVTADALRMVVNVLERIGWFDIPQNRRKFPSDKWQIGIPNVNVDTAQQEIQRANELYQNASVTPVFQMKNSICVLTTSNGVNLCRSINDRRPLLPKWFDICEPLHSNQNVIALKKDNYDTVQTEAYPINADGTLGDIIIESKKYGKYCK